jgi:hypothetical protein
VGKDYQKKIAGTPPGTPVRPGRSPWAVEAWACVDRGCAPPTGPGSCRSPRTRPSRGTEMLGRKAMEQMLAGLSSRRYRVGLGRRAGLRPIRVHQQVGDLPPVRPGHRTRPGRPGERGSVRPGPGRVHGRRGCTSASTCAWSPWASRSTGPRCRWISRRSTVFGQHPRTIEPKRSWGEPPPVSGVVPLRSVSVAMV